MADSENNKSIFSNPDYVSPFGDWAKQIDEANKVTLVFNNYDIKESFCYINFYLHSHNEVSSFAYVFLKTEQNLELKLFTLNELAIVRIISNSKFPFHYLKSILVI